MSKSQATASLQCPAAWNAFQYKSVPYLAKQESCASSCCIVYIALRSWQKQHLCSFWIAAVSHLMQHRTAARWVCCSQPLHSHPSGSTAQYHFTSIPILCLFSPHCHGDLIASPMVTLKKPYSYYWTTIFTPFKIFCYQADIQIFIPNWVLFSFFLPFNKILSAYFYICERALRAFLKTSQKDK